MVQYSCCVCGQSLNSVQLCDPTDCSPPGSPVHEISQARILEWVAIFYSINILSGIQKTWLLKYRVAIRVLKKNTACVWWGRIPWQPSDLGLCIFNAEGMGSILGLGN